MILSLVSPLTMNAASPSTDKTTKYRVYQNNKLIMEYATYKAAEDFAKAYANSHVESIATRKWLWDNFPRYQVYEQGTPIENGSFLKAEAAIAFASNDTYRNVRDLQSTGWLWNNYPKYRVHQGETTLPRWEFTTLKQAIAEAMKWGGSYVIDLTTNQWVWDNYSNAMIDSLRSGPITYRVYQGTVSLESWKFAYLEDAVNEALRWMDSTVVNTNSEQVVYRNQRSYHVFQNANFLMNFTSIDAAITYANRWANSTIVLDEKQIWTNTPYYGVYQSNAKVGEFKSIPLALQYASTFSDASIRTLEQQFIWDNYRKLQVWGWNGTSSTETIINHANGTMGLDVISPTFFELADASGALKDTASTETITYLKQQGLTIYPLVHNQFSSSLTSNFLSNRDAQTLFITSLVNRASELGLPGLNIDFESLAGKDRAAFTAFIESLTQAAHLKNLVISIDLPRGSIKWNQSTAFDHEKLGAIVDYINIMAYDQFWKGSTSPGSVATLAWVEEGIQEFLSYGIPRNKIVLGIPFYVREWKLDRTGKLVGNRAIIMKEIPNIIQTKQVTQTWDDTAQQYKLSYTDNEFTYLLWIENDESVKARLNLAKKYELAGVAAWRLGYDYPDLWKTIIQNK
jgi:spore germination protein YaaH